MQTINAPLAHGQESVAASDHPECIKAQVLAKIGRPPRLHRVEVTKHHGSNYRVNIWQHPEPNKDIAVTLNPRIKWSYYVTVSESGEILHSNPPMIKLEFSI